MWVWVCERGRGGSICIWEKRGKEKGRLKRGFVCIVTAGGLFIV